MSDPDICYKGKYARFVKDKKTGWEYADRVGNTGIVIIIGITKEKELVLIEEFRPPVNASVIGLPAGLAGDENVAEAFTEAARRELLEETGYEGQNFELLTKGPPSPGISSEVVDIYFAANLEKVAAGGGVDGEDITVHVIKLPDVEAWLEARGKEGKMIDPKVYTALYFAARKGLYNNGPS